MYHDISRSGLFPIWVAAEFEGILLYKWNLCSIKTFQAVVLKAHESAVMLKLKHVWVTGMEEKKYINVIVYMKNNKKKQQTNRIK